MTLSMLKNETESTEAGILTSVPSVGGGVKSRAMTGATLAKGRTARLLAAAPEAERGPNLQRLQ